MQWHRMCAIMDGNVSSLMGPRFFQGDLQQLRCFYYAGTYRSFTRAAEELATGQPSVSNHIKQLERLLGARLFQRQRRGVELTPAGRAPLGVGGAPGEGGGRGAVVEAVDGLAQELAERTATLAVGEVRIAAGQELLLHLLAPVIQAFRGDNPTVRLVVYARIRSETQAMAARGEIDFGVAARAGLPPGLEFQEVLADELLLIAPWEHPLAEAEGVSIEKV